MHRIEYNLKLRQEWFAARKLRMGAPPISEQLPTVILNRRALFPYGYNPSIIRWKNRILVAYRYHPNGAGASKLAMAELDNQARVIANMAIDLPAGSVEDPRLFTYADNLCISYVVSNMPSTNPKCQVRWGILREGKPWTVEGQWLPAYGKNDGTGMEKNWVFYEEEGQVKAIYKSSPQVEIIGINEASVHAHHVSRHRESTGSDSEASNDDAGSGHTHPISDRWKWGSIRGGTPPMKLPDGRRFRFFHSRLDNDARPTWWRYYVGACLLDDAGNITAVSKKPILVGSEHDDMAVTERASCTHHKPRVVFPLGAIALDGAWLLSVGINDSACGLVTVKEENLDL